MKLTVHMFVSLDGVVQGPGGPQEDTRGGFTRGGWVTPYTDEEFGAAVAPWWERTGELLLGRTTYDLFAGYWPRVTDPGNGVAAALNAAPKHLVSTTATDPAWGPVDVLGGSAEDVVAGIRALKERPAADDHELQVHGSAGLVAFLHDHGLVDELRLVVFPVVLGQGARLFPEGSVPASYDVVSSRTSPRGLTALTLVPGGGLAVGNHEVVDGQDTARDVTGR